MTLAHDVTGAGPAVLLLHSTVCDRRMWDPQVPALTAAGFRVVRCDLRGYGESPILDGSHDDAYDDVGDVDDLLSVLAIDRLAMVGSSGGGRVTLEFAARHPERVTALALLCTALGGHEPGPGLRRFGEQEDALLEAGDVAAATELNVDLWLGPEADESIRARVRDMQRHAFEVQLAAEHATSEGATADPSEPASASTADPSQTAGAESGGPSTAGGEADYRVITAPALVVSGEHDLPDFREIAERLADQLPRGQHLHLDWAGHLPSLERPDRVNPLLVSFLQESRS